MRIAIPTILSTKRMVGVAEYLINLIEHLQRIDNENEYFILTFPQNRYMFKLWNKNFREIKIPVYDFSRVFLRLNYLLWQIIYFKRFIKRNRIDLVHFPCPWFIPKGLLAIVTIHDIVEYKLSKYAFFNNFIKQTLIKTSINNANKIITVSQNTNQDLQMYFGKKSQTIYNGCTETKSDFISNEIDDLIEKYELNTTNYFLFIGTLQRHKNVLSLIEAYNIFLEANKEYKLVIIGKKDNAYRNIKHKIKKYNLTGYIKILGYLSEKEKNLILQKAFCLVYTSLYEGFGFPIVHAQMRGIPVITSNVSSMPEIAGRGAILVNPEKIIEISQAMQTVTQNECVRKELILNGFQNIKRFSWNQCALDTLKIYNNF